MLATLVAGLATGGCATEALVATSAVIAPPVAVSSMVGGLDMVSLINTDKTITDHVVSLASGKDCSLVRAQEGGEYCEEHYIPRPQQPRQAFCYRTLAQVNCYDAPLGTSDSRVGFNSDPLPPSIRQ